MRQKVRDPGEREAQMSCKLADEIRDLSSVVGRMARSHSAFGAVSEIFRNLEDHLALRARVVECNFKQMETKQ
jgi:microsomal dipeptidase-like Zn-dependent dipeptidase